MLVPRGISIYNYMNMRCDHMQRKLSAMKPRLSPFTLLMVCVFISNTSHNLVHPVTPTLLFELQMPDYIFGIIFACMAFGMLIASPVWGKFSDRHGRRLTFLIGELFYTLSQFLFCNARGELSLIFARMLSGFSASAAIVALMACAIDLSHERNLGRHLSTYAAVVTLASCCGYFLGGIVGSAYSMKGAFVFQYILQGLTVLSVFLFPATDPMARDVGGSLRQHSLKNAFKVLTPVLVLYLSCVILSNMGATGFDNTFNYYLKKQLGLPPSYNGIFKAVSGLLGMVGTLFLNRMLLKHFKTDSVLLMVLLACSLAIALVISAPHALAFFAFSLLFSLFNAMYQPLLQTLMTRASNCDFGLLSGMFNSARSLGMILGSLVAGFLYTLAPKAPFVMQAVGFALSALTVLAFIRLIGRGTEGDETVN